LGEDDFVRRAEVQAIAWLELASGGNDESSSENGSFMKMRKHKQSTGLCFHLVIIKANT